jgi:hypothetical protein
MVRNMAMMMMMQMKVQCTEGITTGELTLSREGHNMDCLLQNML